MSIVEFLSQPLWQRLGLTLVHFLWQGLAVAVLVGVLVRVFRLKHGNARYGAYLLAFIAMIACPVVTFTAIDITISPDTELVTGAESAEVVETFSYTVLPAGDILPAAETSSPAMPTVADSIPLGQRISDWLNVSMPWVLVIWMVGVVVLSVRLLMGFVGVYRWRHHLEPLPERLVQRIVSLSERLRMRGFSRVFISPTVLQAMAVGYLRPMVLLPAAMVAQMQPEMLEAVIAHELAHIRRFDLWVNLIQRVTETLLFYHPAVWWLSICLRSERELCCDELAVKATGRRLAYATTLESVGRAKVMAKQPVLAAGLGQDKKPTLSRVRHILGLKPTQRNCPFWLAGVITVLFLAALVIPTTLALTNHSDEKLTDLERVVVEGIRANRDKFECGYLAWSSKQITTRFSDSNRPAQELAGEYELWWDGNKKIATKYVRDEVHRDPEGNFRVEKGQGGTSYDGGVLSWKPDFHSDNWLGPEFTRWRGVASRDWMILRESNMENIRKDWSVIDANGAKLIRCVSRNTNETDRGYGGYSITDYDPSKGYGLVSEGWYNPDGNQRLKHTVKMLEVIPGGWFPVEVDFKAFAITDWKVYSHNHYALDIERCSFNDKSALPDRVFKGAIDKQLKYQKKLQKYLAMELRGISDVKEAANADKVKLGAREVIEKYIAAAMAGDFEKARQFADPDKAPYDQIADIPEVLKGQNLWIMAVVADDFDAIGVSSVVDDHERAMGPLVFFLDRKPQDGRDNWWLHDIDMETPDSAEVELKKFLEKHPKAQKVPYESKPAVQVEKLNLKELGPNEGYFQLNTNIPVRLELGKVRDYVLVTAKHIRFERKGAELHAVLTLDEHKGGMLAWNTILTLLDAKNKKLAQESNRCNTERFRDPPVLQEQTLFRPLVFAWETVSKAEKFRIEFEQLKPIQDPLGRVPGEFEKYIEGTITDSQGKPIQDAFVTICEQKERGGFRVPQVITDSQGHYQLGEVPWPYKVSASRVMPSQSDGIRRTHSINWPEVYQKADRIDLQFDPFHEGQSTLIVKAKNQFGRPFTNYHIMFFDYVDYENPPEGQYFTKNYRKDVTDPVGSITFSKLPAGDYKIWLIPKDRQYQMPEVRVTIGENQRQEETITILSKLKLYGRILFEDGSPPVIHTPEGKVAKAKISYARKQESRSHGIGEVDENGYLEIHLKEDEYEALQNDHATLHIHIRDLEKDGESKSLGVFPVEKLSKSRESAGTFIAEKPAVLVKGGGSTRTKAQLIKPEIIKTSDGRAKVMYLARYVYCRELAKWVIEKIDFITDENITRNDGKNQLSIVCPTTEDAQTVLKFLQAVDVEPIQVRIDLLVVETYPDVELDHETKIAAENVTHTKFNTSLSAADILRETVKTEPQPENSIEKLIDLLTSRGYLKILMNPTIEVINGKTAKIQSSQRLPSGKEINDSFEFTPRILADGSINVATKMVFENKQIGDPQTHINIKDSESLVIGSVTKTEKRDIVRDGVKGSEERTTEVLVILTPTIITPEMNLSKKPDIPVKIQEKKDQKELSKFKTTLANGVTIELIGMCEYPSADKQWWQPDGSLLVNPPYDESDIDILSFRKPNAIPIEFAFRLSGNLGEPAWEAQVKGDEQAFVWWTGRRAKDGEFLTDIKSIGMFVKSDQRILDLRLGFSFADRPYEWIDFKNISIKPNFKTDVQVEGGEINVETLLNKVRQAQRPPGNMIVEWQSESPNPVIVVAGSRKPDFSPPSRILQTYKAIIAGDKSRIEERELTFQSQKDTEPSGIREITYVFDGTMQKQLDHFVKGFENEYRGYRHTYDKNTQLLLKLLLAYPPYLDSPELQEKYNLKVIENKEKGLIILETSKENSGIHRYTIDPDKDYNIVKQEVILPRGTDYEINCIVKKQANGSWYQVAREKIRYSAKTGKPSLENKVKITKLDFNPEIPTGAFELQFPKGIKIWDGSLKDWVIVGDEEETSREPAIQVEGIYRIRHFVRVVTDDESDRVTFEGQELDHNEFPENLEPLLENVPDRAHTVLEIAFAPGTMPEEKSMAWLGVAKTIGELEEKYGFEYVSIIGEHPLGSKGSISHVYFTGRYIPGEQIPVGLKSVDGLLCCDSIKFKRNRGGEISASLQLGVTSYPKTKWEVRIQLLDVESKEIKAVYETLENSGVVRGRALNSKQNLKLEFGKVANFGKAEKFEIRIRQIKNTKPAMQVEAGKEALTAEKLVLKLVDNSGRPVAGAKVGTSVRTRDKQVLNSKLYWSLSGKEKDFSDKDGKIVLTQDKLFPQSWNPDRKRALYILNEERQIGAFCEISRDNERNQIELTLEPVCHVHGNLSSKDLEEIGRPLTWSNVYLGINKDSQSVLSCMSEKQQFDFWVPPGEYKLRAYGSGDGARTKTIQPIIEVKTGQSELDLGVVDLPATKLSKMMGKSAPEIGPIKAWKNGSPITLAELRGKAVIIYFDGTSPNTSRDLPRLVDLHNQFEAHGLVIVALYNCPSMEALEAKWVEVYKKYGGVQNVPFRVAVDGGKSTFYEGSGKERLGATYAIYDITADPTTILIDPDGKIVEKLGLYGAKEKLEKMLGVEVKTTVSAWRQRFEEVYRLEDNRILKRIAPPFIPERRDYYVNEDSSQASIISRSPDRFIFHWNGKLKNWGLGFTNKLDLDSILRRVLRLKSFEYDGPEELLSIELPGDWIIRDEVTQKVKLKALEQLIAEELSRTIQFEKRTVERQVIVATGSFKFHPPSETYEHKSVHLYTDELDPDEGSGGGTADSVNDFILILGSLVDMPMVDHTESSKKNMVPYRHHRSSYLRKIKDKAEKASKLQMLLAILTKQTELQFRIQKRPVEVWFITEKKKDK